MISPVFSRGIHLRGGKRIMPYRDPEKAREYRKKYYQEHKEERKAHMKAYKEKKSKNDTVKNIKKKEKSI